MGKCAIKSENGLELQCDILSVNLDNPYVILEVQVYQSKEITGDYLLNRNKKRKKFRLFRRFRK